MVSSKESRAIALAFTLALAACGGHAALTPPSPTSNAAAGAARAMSSSGAAGARTASKKIQHIIIIVQENRSFDDLFQGYPNANTASSGKNSKGQTIQLASVPLEANYDIDHNFSTWNLAYDNGKMDGWNKEIAFGNGKNAYPNPQYGYVPQSEIGPYLSMAQQYVLDDEMFASDIDGSFVAHQYLIAAQSNSEVNYPTSAWGCKGGSGDTIHQLTQQRQITQTSVPVCEDYQTLADELDAAKQSWRMYAPPANNTGALWSAFQAISHIYNGPDWTQDVISPQTKILTDIPAGSLAAVTWVIPSLADSDHARSDSNHGPGWVASVVNAVGQSQFWNTSAIFVLWDDWGGWFDHVAPKQLDYDGLGFRVPMLCISPYALSGVVSHKQYEFGSVLHFIENNFGLKTLAASDSRALAADHGCLNYNQAPRPFTPITSSLGASYFVNERASGLSPDDE